ncbi:MFS transporter [Mycolicibacter senuensis]|uniref:Putative proline/betaine transporter n=1 Tax=Mycolicibacter senuensis TaxID=386913 RepID=A0A7I9XMP2_9MYCO|nr:MFS transporter [Mycolicibacter senuensis]MDQ2626921.1 MFS transporter [Actinomycetota bacterium]ORW66232.1 MFS transporter [Mycolicibacter senuensis]GFG71245.1 general substrate transporter Major facilitator superfamily protein [Mycolicibacter senuensis]
MSLLLPASRPPAPAKEKRRSTAEQRNRVLRKAIVASAVGNATEWYDYGVYAVVATYLTDAFFPDTLGNLGTMLGFAVSFVLRPLGGMVWGPIGDRFGRKSVLVATVLLIAVATTLIGVLPTYATAGWWAPGLLIALRIVQGFSTGGEYGGAATFMAESAPDAKRGTYGSFLEFGAVAGFVMGTAVVLALEATFTHEQMVAWGWRIPFLLALPLGVVGLVLRSRMEETPVFAECVACEEITGSAWDRLVDLLTNYTRPILVTFALFVVLNIIDYTLVTYQPTYLHASAGLDERSRTTVVLIGELAMLACIPFAGAWSDRVGRKPLWRVSLLGFAVLGLPMYWLMGHGFVWALVGFTVLSVLFAAPLATVSATFPALFPTQVRYAGFAIADNAAVAVFGGTAPVLADSVIERTGWHLFPAAYLVFAALIGLVALRFLPETLGYSLRGTGIPGVPGELERELSALAAEQSAGVRRNPAFDEVWAVDKYLRPQQRTPAGYRGVPQLAGVSGPRIRV